ncbi:MAG: ABC transporter permease [Thermoproteota archaeon]|nr:MAG: ABC transporter permease [Candidatus Korarchaeota archaeon]
MRGIKISAQKGRIIILAVFLLVLVLMYLQHKFGLRVIGLIEAGLYSTTLLTFVAVGECINEKAGVINIGLEGILTLSAIVGTYGAEVFENGVAGLLIGMLTGASIGFLLGILATYGMADQVIAGLAINLFAIGFGPYLLMALWHIAGIHVLSRELMLPRMATPLGYISPLTVVAIVIAILAQLFLDKTLYGLRIKVAGEKPEAVDVAGIRVDRLRIFTSTLGGALCGLGGAYLPLCWFGSLVKEVSAGRGFIALSCVVFGGLEPVLAFLAATIFGFAEGFGYWISITPGIKEIVPVYFIHMTPYIITLIVVTSVIGKKRFPKALGRPYIRE